MLLAMVPAAPPTRKNQRTTSWPAPISAKVPYQRGSRLIFNAFEWVSTISSFTSRNGYSFHQENARSSFSKGDKPKHQALIASTRRHRGLLLLRLIFS